MEANFNENEKTEAALTPLCPSEQGPAACAEWESKTVATDEGSTVATDEGSTARSEADGSAATREAASTTEPESPSIVLASRPLSAAHYVTVSRLERKIPRFLWVTVIFLLWAMAVNAAGYALVAGGQNGYGIALATLWILALVAGGFYAYAQYRERKNLRRQFAQGLLGENSDEQVVELYENYLVALTPHSRTVIRYEEVTAFWETPSLLVLFSESAAVTWQADDCTPFDAGLLKSFLCERIPASVRHQKGVFWARLPYPLPIPVLHSSDQPVMTCTHVPRFSTKLWNEGWFPVCNKSLPVWFAVSAVLGVFMTSAYWWDAPLLRLFAPWFLLCFFVACPLLSLLCVFLQQRGVYRALRRAPDGGRKPVWLTRDGLCVQEGGNLVFVPRGALTPRYKKWGVLLLLPSGAITIPWEQIPDPAAFRQHFALI